MDKELIKVIAERQLVSVMNQTKWRELCQEFSKNNTPDPSVRYKLIYSDQIFSFGLVWWHEILQDAPAIEWLNFDPIKHEPRGRLVSPKETDTSNEILTILKRYNISYSMKQSYIRVWGYLNQSESPVFL